VLLPLLLPLNLLLLLLLVLRRTWNVSLLSSFSRSDVAM
jgi:hypothetical protein